MASWTSTPCGTAGTSKSVAAGREFAREEFGLQHRYAMVLHTDEDHPHVHLVVAHRMDGQARLNIRKADLRRYREQFARQLRSQGVSANATPAQLRGKLMGAQRDGRYRAELRGEVIETHQDRTMPGSDGLRLTGCLQRQCLPGSA